MRSRAAAAVLSREGFKDVFSMEGGIRVWKGLAAKGAPETAMAYFPPASSPGELIALAWLLEDGSRKFYIEAAKMNFDPKASHLLQELAAAEEAHQNTLFGMYKEISGRPSGHGFPRSIIPAQPGEEYMEGGVPLAKALAWVKGKDLSDLLEFSISQEVNSEDLYIKMERKVSDEKSKKIFMQLAQQEKQHLAKLTVIFEKS